MQRPDNMVKHVLKKLLGARGSAVVRALGSRHYPIGARIHDIATIPIIRSKWVLLRARNAGARPRSHVCASEHHHDALTAAPAFAHATERAVSRAKPHVLFVTEKWCDGNSEHGLSNNTHNFFGSLEASALATHSAFYYDEYRHLYSRPGDAALLKLCLERPPDLLFLTWMPFGPYNPELETLRIIRGMGIPIVAWWGDTVNPINMQMAERVSSFVEFNVVADSSTSYLGSKRQEKYLHIFTPQDPRVFHDAALNRDIGISFLGSIQGNHYADRRAGLDALRKNGVAVYKAGGQRENPLSVDEYARTYMRSKIALNFSRAAGQWTQLKGHVFEATLCGAMLLESENSETSRLFEPMVDYVPFASEADLVQKARYYLEHDSERVAIARRGHQKATERYTGDKFWKTILNKVLVEH